MKFTNSIILISLLAMTTVLQAPTPCVEVNEEIGRRLENSLKYYGLPRLDPKRFIYDNISLPLAQGTYSMPQEKKIALIESLKAVILSFKDSTDPIARSSVSHMEKHWARAEEFRAEIEQMGIDFIDYMLLVTAHDLGKFYPDPQVLSQAKDWAKQGLGNERLLGRISWHDMSTVSYLRALAAKTDISYLETSELIADIMGHNDGSGLKDVWWNRVGWPEETMGKYPSPRRLQGLVLAFYDRYDQGDRNGVTKITKELVASAKFSKTVITETHLRNSQNTIRQLNEIAAQISVQASQTLKYRFNFTTTRGYQKAMAAQQTSIDAYHRIQWSENGSVAQVKDKNGRLVEARSFDEFFSPEFQAAMWQD